MKCGTDPPKTRPHAPLSTKIFQTLLVLKSLPPPSPDPRAFYLAYLNWKQKHENANLLQNLMQNNSQEMRKTNEIEKINVNIDLGTQSQ